MKKTKRKLGKSPAIGAPYKMKKDHYDIINGLGEKVPGKLEVDVKFNQPPPKPEDITETFHITGPQGQKETFTRNSDYALNEDKDPTPKRVVDWETHERLEKSYLCLQQSYTQKNQQYVNTIQELKSQETATRTHNAILVRQLRTWNLILDCIAVVSMVILVLGVIALLWSVPQEIWDIVSEVTRIIFQIIAYLFVGHMLIKIIMWSVGRFKDDKVKHD